MCILSDTIVFSFRLDWVFGGHEVRVMLFLEGITREKSSIFLAILLPG